MAVRAGMADLIQRVRGFTYAGTADFTAGTVSYFSDQHIQDALDHNQRIWKQAMLEPIPTRSGPQTLYYDYGIPGEVGRWFEQDDGTGNTTFVVRDNFGTAIAGTAFTVNYLARTIHFPTDQGPYTRYLDCNVYDLFAACAEVCEAKAGAVANSTDWSADNHAVKLSQRYEHWMGMAKKFRAKRGIVSMEFFRTDETWGMGAEE